MLPGCDLKEEDRNSCGFQTFTKKKKQKHQWLYTSTQKVSTPYWKCKRLVAIDLREQV